MDLYNFLILLSPSVLIIAALAFAAVMRYIAYKERVALVERGADIQWLLQNQRLGKQGNRGVLWAGTITATSGLGVLLGLWMLGRGVWLIAGFVPLSVGLGLMAIYYLTRGPASSHPGTEKAPATGEENPLSPDSSQAGSV